MDTNFREEEYFTTHDGKKVLDASRVIRRHLDELIAMGLASKEGTIHWTDSSVDEISDLHDYYSWLIGSMNSGDAPAHDNDFPDSPLDRYGPEAEPGWMLSPLEVEALERLTGRSRDQFMYQEDED